MLDKILMSDNVLALFPMFVLMAMFGIAVVTIICRKAVDIWKRERW